MATKKSSKGSSNMWMWVYVIGGLVAAVAGALSFSNQYLTWLLVLAGVLVGWLYMDTSDLTGFGVRYLLFGAVNGVLGAVPAVGGYISGFFGGFFAFLGPVALAMLAKWFWDKYFASMM